MAYDHSKKAGNLGDIWKHAVLVSIAERLEGRTHFRYVESHSGAPIHSLSGSGEWRRGIGAIVDKVDKSSHPYWQMAKSYVSRKTYPAGWLFFAKHLAPRLGSLDVTLYDTSESVAQRYRDSLLELMPPNAKGTFRKRDGYSALESVEADLVFIDPPFAPEDWGLLVRGVNVLKERQIPFAAWYPIFWPTKPSQLIRATSQPSWEVMWREFGAKPCQNMKGCGMLFSDDLIPIIEMAHSKLEVVANLIGSDDGIRIRSVG